MTTLKKSILTTYVPGSPGSPGSPGQPYLPARTTYETQTICSWQNTVGSSAPGVVIVRDAFGNLILGYPAGLPGAPAPTPQYICTSTQVRVDRPAQPFVAPTPPVPSSPAQFQTDYNLGWTGRANSIGILVGNGAVRFRLPPNNIGSVVGLSKAPRDTGFSDILFGFNVSGGIARAYEAGLEVDNFGAILLTDVLMIQREGADLNYLINGSVVRTTTNTNGPMFLAAALYAGGDSVLDAAFEYTLTSALRMPAMEVFSGVSSYKGAIAKLHMPGLLAESAGAGPGASCALVMPGLKSISGKAYGLASLRMPPVSEYSESFGVLPYGIVALAFPYFESGATGLTGGVGGSALILPFPEVLGYDRDFADARLILPQMTSNALLEVTNTEVQIFSFAGASFATFEEVAYFVEFNSIGEATGLLVAVETSPVDMLSEGQATTPWSTTDTINALIQSLASGSSLQFDGPGNLAVWAVNAHTAGSSRYENYSYNSFARIGNKFFGAKADGVYLLEGAKDDGTNIDARINLGNLSFGTTLLKGLNECYVGVASDGKIIVKVTANGQTYYYSARASSDNLSTQRVDMGRGFRSNLFELELQNTDGGAFELSTVEFTPVPLSRRI